MLVHYIWLSDINEEKNKKEYTTNNKDLKQRLKNQKKDEEYDDVDDYAAAYGVCATYSCITVLLFV